MIGVSLDDVALHARALAKLDEQIRTGDRAHQTKALFLLSRGELREGWPEYEYRIKAEGRITYDRLPVRRWQGEDLSGKDVLVWLEQGIGDQIFAAGMLLDLLAVAGSVTLFCDARLAPVFRRSFPRLSVHRVGEPVSPRVAAWAFDCQMSVADLGIAFRPELPKQAKPYLTADPAHVAALRRRYAPNGERLVGVSWASGNPDHGAAKSMTLDMLAPALKADGTVYVSLQYEARDAGGLLVDPAIDPMLDIDGALAQTAAMDKVITASNSTAHMAGALGVPGIVMLPRGVGRLWYWHADRRDSPWYPSLTLIRQNKENEWTSVVDQVGMYEVSAGIVTSLRSIGALPSSKKPLRLSLPSHSATA